MQFASSAKKFSFIYFGFSQALFFLSCPCIRIFFSISVHQMRALCFYGIQIFFCTCPIELPSPLVLPKEKPAHSIGRIRPPKRGVFQTLLHRLSSGTIPHCSHRSLCRSRERRTMPVYSSLL